MAHGLPLVGYNSVSLIARRHYVLDGQPVRVSKRQTNSPLPGDAAEDGGTTTLFGLGCRVIAARQDTGEMVTATFDYWLCRKRL